jgi:hypothetical protein
MNTSKLLRVVLTDWGVAPILRAMKPVLIVALTITFGLTVAAINNTLGTLSDKLEEHEAALEAVVQVLMHHQNVLQENRDVMEVIIEHQNKNFL